MAGTCREDYVVLSSPQPGRKKGHMYITECVFTCITRGDGGGLEIKLYAMVRFTHTKYNSLVHAGPNREWGFYHHILLKEFLKITSVLSEAIMQ